MLEYIYARTGKVYHILGYRDVRPKEKDMEFLTALGRSTTDSEYLQSSCGDVAYWRVEDDGHRAAQETPPKGRRLCKKCKKKIPKEEEDSMSKKIHANLDEAKSFFSQLKDLSSRLLGAQSKGEGIEEVEEKRSIKELMKERKKNSSW